MIETLFQLNRQIFRAWRVKMIISPRLLFLSQKQSSCGLGNNTFRSATMMKGDTIFIFYIMAPWANVRKRMRLMTDGHGHSTHKKGRWGTGVRVTWISLGPPAQKTRISRISMTIMRWLGCLTDQCSCNLRDLTPILGIWERWLIWRRMKKRTRQMLYLLMSIRNRPRFSLTRRWKALQKMTSSGWPSLMALVLWTSAEEMWSSVHGGCMSWLTRSGRYGRIICVMVVSLCFMSTHNRVR